MKELLTTLQLWQAEGMGVGRAVVVRTYGSAPRQPGAVLLYASDGRVAGSVSGGCVEGAAAEEIEAARESGKTKTVRYGISDEQAWSVGFACGGTIDVLIEPAVPEEALDAASRDDGTVVITPLPGDERTEPSPRLVFAADGGLRGTTGSAETDEAITLGAGEALLRGTSGVLEIGERSFFLETYPVRPRLVIVGAVEVARALVTIAHELGFETVVIDGRAAFASRERFPQADQLIVAWPDEAFAKIRLNRDDSVAVLSHDVKFDEPAILEALQRGCRYVGAIGSKKTQADRRERLRSEGVSLEDVARLHGPIGLDLGGKAPAEMALAILAEVVAERYGASGSNLRDRAQPAG
jgi:xanthine dehydrogenase accessory factor